MQNIMARFIKDESGATAIEYGLLAALIGVGIVAGASTLGNNLNNGLATVGNKVATESAKV
jgi:pilus assembly protein Flp/PilA